MRGFMCFWGLRRDHGMQWGSVYLSITAQASIYLQSNAQCKCSSTSSLSLISSSSYSSSFSSSIYLQSIVVEPGRKVIGSHHSAFWNQPSKSKWKLKYQLDKYKIENVQPVDTSDWIQWSLGVGMVGPLSRWPLSWISSCHNTPGVQRGVFKTTLFCIGIAQICDG